MTDIILVGGGGHCKSCIDVIRAVGAYNILGIVDRKERIGSSVAGYTVVGSDEDLGHLLQRCRNFFITVGQLEDPGPRKKLFTSLVAAEAVLPVLTAPGAHVSPAATVGMGTIVFFQALVNNGAVVGDNCIINNGALVEHDTKIGNHCHISTGAVVNGGCEVGDETFIGSNAAVIQGIHIAPRVVIGAGSVVIRDITEPGTYVGNPARRIS